MVPQKQVSAWIRQAEADLEAAKADTSSLAECHRRYLIQQSYEKAIKALALMLWESSTAAEMAQFDNLFLKQHSPLKTMADNAGDLYKPLYHLNRQLTSFLKGQPHGDILLKIDSTKPTTRPDKVSYRYPFIDDESGDHTAPANFNQWDIYQGTRSDALKGVAGLLSAVNERLKLHKRAPK